jgi:hypothetical protein
VSNLCLSRGIEEAAVAFSPTLKKEQIGTSRRPLPYCRVSCPTAATPATADICMSTPTAGQLGSTPSSGFPKDLCWVWSVVHSGCGAIAFIVLGLLLSLHRVLLPNGTHLLRTWYRLHSTSLNPDLPALSHVTTISSQIPDPWPTSPTQGEPVPVPTL